MFFCYVLQSEKSGRYYIGSCEHLEQRLQDHNRGRVIATRSKGPWKIRYHEALKSRSEAVARELEIKSWKSRGAMEALFRD